jgi:hypothetical protein
MWTYVCSITPRYSNLTEHFYARARKYAEKEELKSFGERVIGLPYCQCWSLIAAYELKTMYFPRAWLSIGRAAKLAQLMKFHQLDSGNTDVKLTCPPPRDWIEKEERTRTFWMIFCQDRNSCVATGWPTLFFEKDVRFPSSPPLELFRDCSKG